MSNENFNCYKRSGENQKMTETELRIKCLELVFSQTRTSYYPPTDEAERYYAYITRTGNFAPKPEEVKEESEIEL